MTEPSSLSQYRQIFIQQRWFNYCSILASLLTLGVTWILITIELPIWGVAITSFMILFAIMILASRVRANPIIRCTIEHADPRLYANLWGWSIAASCITFIAYIACSMIIWHAYPDNIITLKAYTILCSVNGLLLIATAVE